MRPYLSSLLLGCVALQPAFGFVPRTRMSMMASTVAPATTATIPEVKAPSKKDIVNPVFNEVCDLTGVTLTRYMMEVCKANPTISELESLMNSIQTACKTISNLVNRATIDKLVGLEDGGGSINVQGEEQKKLDVITNNVLKKALRFTGRLSVLASEEEDVPVWLDDEQFDRVSDNLRTSDVVVEEGGKYVAVFDPLDGSSNVDASIPVGTIFGIFEADQDDENCIIDMEAADDGVDAQMAKCLLQTLQPGSNLVAAGYCLYSSSMHLVFTLGNGVVGFTYDQQIGEFVLTMPDIKIPKRGKIYSFNEANRWDWDKPLQEYVTAIQTGNGETGVRYSSRYIGSMVGDVHRTLLYGGLFGYPASVATPNGKLRLLYEAAPMAFLVEQAGGMALTGKNRILDIKPKNVHQRVPCILGSVDDVTEMRNYYEASKDPELIRRCLDRLG